MPLDQDFIFKLVGTATTTPEVFDRVVAEHKLSVDTCDRLDGIPLLVPALRGGSLALLKHLVEKRKISLDYLTAFTIYVLAAQSKPEILTYAVDRENPLGAYVRKGVSVFQIDIAQGHLEAIAIKLHLSLGYLVDAQSKDKLPLMLATYLKKEVVAEFIFSYSKAFIKDYSAKGDLSALLRHYLDLGCYYFHAKKNNTLASKYYALAIQNGELLLKTAKNLTPYEKARELHWLVEAAMAAAECKNKMALVAANSSSYMDALNFLEEERFFAEKANAWLELIPRAQRDDNDSYHEVRIIKDLALSHEKSAEFIVDSVEKSDDIQSPPEYIYELARKSYVSAVLWYEKLMLEDNGAELVSLAKQKAQMVILRGDLQGLVGKAKADMREGLSHLNGGNFSKANDSLNLSIASYTEARSLWRNDNFKGNVYYQAYYSQLSLIIASLRNTLAYSLECLGDRSCSLSLKSSSVIAPNSSELAATFAEKGSEFYKESVSQRNRAMRFFKTIPKVCRNELYRKQLELSRMELSICTKKMLILNPEESGVILNAVNEEKSTPSPLGTPEMNTKAVSSPKEDPPTLSL